MVNIRTLGAAIEASRPGALDERGTRTPCKMYGCPLAMLVMHARGVPHHRRGVIYQRGKGQVDAHWDKFVAHDEQGA